MFFFSVYQKFLRDFRWYNCKCPRNTNMKAVGNPYTVESFLEIICLKAITDLPPMLVKICTSGNALFISLPFVSSLPKYTILVKRLKIKHQFWHSFCGLEDHVYAPIILVTWNEYLQIMSFCLLYHAFFIHPRYFVILLRAWRVPAFLVLLSTK